MTNIFKIILTTFRIIFKLIKFPFAFLLIIFALLDLAGIIGPFTPGDDIEAIIGVFSIGAYIIYSGMRKEKNVKRKEGESIEDFKERLTIN